MADSAISFDATCYKVQTLVDNGLRVTLDLPEQAIEAAAVLMALKRADVVLKVTIEPDTSGRMYKHAKKDDAI